MAGQRALTSSRGARFALLCAIVLAAHFAGLWSMRRLLEMNSVLRAMPTAMYTRMLTAQAPAQPAATRAPSQEEAAPARRPTARTVPRKSEPDAATAPPPPEPPVAANEPQPAASAPAPAASAPSPPVTAEAPAEGASASAATANPAMSAPGTSTVESWPADTQLTYRLTGNYRGPLYGTAHVQWQREGSHYQVRVELNPNLFPKMTFTSQGEITAKGLVPAAYEEVSVGKTRAVRMTGDSVTLNDGRSVPRPEGAQDTASQFIELSHRFTMGQEQLQVPGQVSLWMTRPGGVDQWTYDIVEREVLTTYAGPVDTFHLKPRPLANPRGNITAEIWFAPSLLYLPIRIRVNMGADTYVDLMMEKIEQGR